MNEQELTYFLIAYGNELYAFCRYLCGGENEADDLYQDTCLFLAEKADLRSEPDDLKRYGFAVATRIWQNRKKKFAVRTRILTEQVYPNAETKTADDIPYETLLQDETHSRVAAEISALPAKQRPVVLLYYMEEMAEQEIAELLHIPLGTVKSRLHTARQTLKRRLKDLREETL